MKQPKKKPSQKQQERLNEARAAHLSANKGEESECKI